MFCFRARGKCCPFSVKNNAVHFAAKEKFRPFDDANFLCLVFKQGETVVRFSAIKIQAVR